MKLILFQKDFIKHFRFNNLMRKCGYFKMSEGEYKDYFRKYLATSQPYSAVLHYPDHFTYGMTTKPPAKRASYIVRFIRAFKSAWNTT